MSSLMKNYQLVISAAGVTSTELLTIGIPTIIVYGDPHEKEAANILQQKNTVINLGYGKNISKNILTKTIQTVLHDYNARRILHKNSKKLFDGKGTTRIVQKIMSEYCTK